MELNQKSLNSLTEIKTKIAQKVATTCKKAEKGVRIYSSRLSFQTYEFPKNFNILYRREQIRDHYVAGIRFFDRTMGKIAING